MRGLFGLLVGFIAAAPALGGEAPEHLRASLISEQASFVPGQTTYLGLHMDLDDEWHTYWKGVNVTGYPVVIETEAPEGWTVGETLWPAPHRYKSPGRILDHVYEHEVTLIIPIHVGESARVGSEQTVKVDAEWLVCREACVPGWGELSITLPVTAAPVESDGTTRAKFKASRDRLPKPVGAGDGVSWTWRGDEVVFGGKGASRIAFYPEEGSAEIEDLFERGESKGDALRLRVNGKKEPVRGILEVWRNEQESRVYAIDIPQPAR